MAVRKICKQTGRRASPRCNHPWWFDVMHQGTRWRMPIDDFALARGATEAVTSKQNAEHRYVGAPMHDRLIGALETCSRQGEMLRIQNRHVDWEKHQIAIPGKHAKDRENRRIPFDPEGHLAPILKRRKSLGPTRSCSARRLGSTQRASRPPGNLCCSSPTATTRNARNTVLGSIARSSGRSTCTGTTSVTRAPAGS
jgi:integrase